MNHELESEKMLPLFNIGCRLHSSVDEARPEPLRDCIMHHRWPEVLSRRLHRPVHSSILLVSVTSFVEESYYSRSRSMLIPLGQTQSDKPKKVKVINKKSIGKHGLFVVVIFNAEFRITTG
jgi:hypothetical protein